MKQKNKDLLLQDLCARVPYGLIVACDNNDGTMHNTWKVAYINKIIEDVYLLNTESTATQIISVKEIKPYLFPLSSMTEKQKNDMFNYCYNTEHEASKFSNGKLKFVYDYEIVKIDWCNKNNFDYRGLIELGLAIDATNLNIY